MLPKWRKYILFLCCGIWKFITRHPLSKFISWFFLVAFIEGQKRHMANFTIFRETPGISPRAWPLQSNSTIRASLFSSLKFQQPSLGISAVIFLPFLTELHSDTFPDSSIWLFGFNNSCCMRGNFKRIDLQGCPQESSLVLYTKSLLVLLVTEELPGSITTLGHPVSYILLHSNMCELSILFTRYDFNIKMFSSNPTLLL